jgi:hypothetical protein
MLAITQTPHSSWRFRRSTSQKCEVCIKGSVSAICFRFQSPVSLHRNVKFALKVRVGASINHDQKEVSLHRDMQFELKEGI